MLQDCTLSVSECSNLKYIAIFWDGGSSIEKRISQWFGYDEGEKDRRFDYVVYVNPPSHRNRSASDSPCATRLRLEGRMKEKKGKQM